MIDPFAAAVQGLGFGFAQLALQGLLIFVAAEVEKNEQGGSGSLRRTRRMPRPAWAPAWPVDDDETLLLLGLV